MGHRANFVVVRNRLAKAYCDQWAALGCLHGFAEGPDEAVRALDGFEPTTELMDWAFAEGGYLIDYDERIGIVFGYDEADFSLGELNPESDSEPAQFEAANYLAGIAPNWRGWKLVFDDRGVDAFASHLRLHRIDGIKCQPISHPDEIKPPCVVRA